MRSSVISRLVPPPFVAALLLGLVTSGCGASVADDLRHAASANRVPENFTVVYDDHTGARGGIRLVLRANRTLAVQRWAPGQAEDTPTHWSGRVPAESFDALVDLLVEIEAWEQRASEEEGRLEDAKGRLSVRLGEQRTSIWEYVTDMEATGRVLRVKQHVEALAFELRHPLIDGADAPLPGDRAP